MDGLNLEIAKAVLNKIGGNIDLGITLAAATIGGIIALLTKLYFDLKPSTHPFEILQDLKLILIAFIFTAVSSLFGHLAQGNLAAVIPNLFSHEFQSGISLTYADFEGHQNLQILMQIQYIFLLSSFCLIFVFLFKNIKSIHKK
ncbi:MAG: hypothetical protein ACSHX4_03880 [Opitutaceae bacterium]